MLNGLAAERNYNFVEMYGATGGAVEDLMAEGALEKGEASTDEASSSTSLNDASADKQMAVAEQQQDFSTTNLQVTGVDESDCGCFHRYTETARQYHTGAEWKYGPYP